MEEYLHRKQTTEKEELARYSYMERNKKIEN